MMRPRELVGSAMMPNLEVVWDIAERAEAQQVIDATPAEVIDYANAGAGSCPS